MIGKTLGHYQIKEKLGEGGMGVVYKAYDSRLLRHVALKILPLELVADKKYLDRFIREAQAASALNHPNICTVYDIGEENGIRFIIMEYVRGQTLREVLNERGVLPEKQVVEIGKQICDALAAAHAKGIIHRDIKPDNIIMMKDGRVKVLDFGLAKLTNTIIARTGKGGKERNGRFVHSATHARTSFSSIQGTVFYMAPEQIDHSEIDARADIFSLGIVLYEMLTGKTPFTGTDNLAVMKSILKNPARKPSAHNKAISRGIDTAVLRALEKSPNRRYSNIVQLKAGLEKLITEGNLAKRTGQKTQLSIFAGVSVLLLLMVSVFIFKRFLFGEEETGEIPRTIKKRSIAQSLQGFANPFFYVDGQHIVGSGVKWHDAARDSLVLFVKNIDTGERKRLLQIPFDSYSSSISGDFAPVNEKFVFSKTSTTEPGIFVLDDPQGQPRRLVDFGFSPKWSPDGKRILFADTTPNDVGQNSAIHLFDYDSNVLMRISPENGEQYAYPSWSPDGRWIVCTGGYGSKSEIWLIEVETGKTHQVSRRNAWIFHPVWSKKNNFIYFLSDKNGSRDLWCAEIDAMTAKFTKEPVQLTHGSSFVFLAISPDEENQLLLHEVSKSSRLYATRLPGYDKTDLPDAAYFSSTFRDLLDMDISPDGSHLVMETFHAGVRTLMLVSTKNGSESILYKNKEQPAFAPCWSHDGKWIVFDAGGGDNADIWRIPANGGQVERIVEHPGADWFPTYSPDGRYLCFISNRSGNLDLWIKNLHTGKEDRLTDTKGIESRGFWSRDGKRLAFFQNSEKGNRASIMVYDFAGKAFIKIKQLSEKELSYFPGKKISIFSKLAWSADNQKLYFGLNQGGFVELDLATKTTRPVYDMYGKTLKLDRVFSIFESILYYPINATNYDILLIEGLK